MTAAALPRTRLDAPDAPRAVVYTRVSSDLHDTGRSVTEQEAECRTVCERSGWRVVAHYSDNDRSASRYARKARPQYRRLIEHIESGGVDVLVTWEASRAQRDLADYAKLRDLCERRGVLLSYSGRTYDLAEADDRFSTGLDALLAERYADETRKRVLRAVRANADAGKPHGRLLYGYRREYDTHGRLVRQVPDEETAPVVREAAFRVLNGETPNAVAVDFTRRRIAPPAGAPGDRWELTQIRRMCVNPGYAGKRVHRGQVVGAAGWEPILDLATHEALVAKLSDPARRTVRDASRRYLLSGIAVCGVCGGRIRVQPNRGFLAYLCAHNFHVSRRQDHLDTYVEAVVIERLKRPDLAELLTPDDDAETLAALTEAREKRGRLTEFYDAAAAGELTPAALSRIEARLLPEIEAAERRARPATIPAVVMATAGEDAERRWAELSLSQRREVVDALCTVKIMPTTRGQRTFDTDKIVIEWHGTE